MLEKEIGRAAGTDATQSNKTRRQLINYLNNCQTESCMPPALKEVMAACTVRPSDMVELVAAKFPSFDLTSLSKCLKPEKYGIVLHPDGFAAIAEAFFTRQDPPEPETKSERIYTAGAPVLQKKSNPENRKFNNRISGRLPDDKYTRLQALMREDGYMTTQDWILAQVDEYIFRREHHLKVNNEEIR